MRTASASECDDVFVLQLACDSILSVLVTSGIPRKAKRLLGALLPPICLEGGSHPLADWEFQVWLSRLLGARAENGSLLRKREIAVMLICNLTPAQMSANQIPGHHSHPRSPCCLALGCKCESGRQGTFLHHLVLLWYTCVDGA